jgi:hypothetical protein
VGAGDHRPFRAEPLVDDPLNAQTLPTGIRAGYRFRGKGTTRRRQARRSLRREAVAKTVGWNRRWLVMSAALVTRIDRCDPVGALSGPRGGEVVAVELGQVVSHHQ